MNDCIFCKIARGQIHAEVVYESELVVAFKDIQPAAPVHVLIIPREHLENLNAIGYKHADLLLEIHEAIQEVARRMGVYDAGYRLISNCGKSAGQSVFHLHYHLLGGRDMGEFVL